MRRLGFVAAVVAALLPAAASAQLSLGVRVGWAFGLGDVGGTLSMSDWVAGQLPLQVDALYRVSPHLALGAYYSYGFGQPGGDAADACDLQGAECTAAVQRLGVQATWAFGTRRGLAPWIGANVGYEWATLEDANPASAERVTFEGWEYLGVQGGLDLRLGRRLVAGPFAGLSIGRYGAGESTGASTNGSSTIPDEELHAWATLGIRGRFDL